MVAPRRNDRVAVIAYNGLTTFEYAIPAEIFGLPRPELERYYEMKVVAGEAGPLRAAFGLSVEADGGLELLADAGTVVIPGWRDRSETPPTALLDAVRDAHVAGARLVSICSGAFVLAAAGLLDGRRATTHWMYADDLARWYPEIDVDAAVLYVDDHSIVTAAGSAAGIDACLHLVRSDWGDATANVVARRLVVSPHRDGGQAQFIQEPVAADLADGDRGIAQLLDELRSELGHQHTTASMAASIHVSPRTLLRRFSAATGTSPGRWLANQRIARGRYLLETTDRSVEAIAAELGYGAAVSFRQQFVKRMHTTPSAYRARFAGV